MQIKNRIKEEAGQLTPNERKLAAAILSDYPYGALVSIQELAKHAEVSAPSISRFVTKIGLSGYQEFQRALISELREGNKSPIDVHTSNRAIDGGYLKDFTTRSSELLAEATAAITEDQFEKICSLLADPKREVHILGGRVSDTLAYVLSFHLRQTRKGIYHLPLNIATWPEYLLRMRQGDILFVVDFRRYQPTLLRLCEHAHERGARIILMTDKWLSPVAKHAAEVLPVPIESGTLWDTYTPALAVIEALATKVAEDNFDQTRTRIEAWDAMRVTDEEPRS